ncbi:MAG: hypothetical protein ACREDR_29045, partial [Blastocatellia bacterium]
MVLDNTVVHGWRYGHQHVGVALREYFRSHQQPPALTSVSVYEALRGFSRDGSGEVEPQFK